ncbi:Stress responsive A/B Barrel Domain [Catalinimonas alkaloidigena]|uniref:Stress responsive A/B Barrel Domain n=1 Tax=Catalinimonas alkaloidigena TaxID=1075417 RepID=A0A1G9F2T0_9BACT|nr:Dabb family protein [Catalinimonas alkaloidigena]SDK82712.1 Stress responsive A/B Barrel Domain [Catalinimonas alkaloidigena]
MFVHHVFFWLKSPNDATVRAEFTKALQELVTISTIRQSHIGIPAATNRPVVDNTYAFSLLLMFDNKADHDDYQDDPDHHRFIERCSAWWERVQVYDAVETD